MTLPNDICRCRNSDCELRKDCLRWTSHVVGKWTPLTWFVPVNGKCEHQIKPEERDE